MKQFTITNEKGPIDLDPPELNDLAESYQQAYKYNPWFEVSRCQSPAESRVFCRGGFSPFAVGSECPDCRLATTEPAYPTQELTTTLRDFLARTDAALYRERSIQTDDLALAALARRLTASSLASWKYPRNEKMKVWLEDRMGGDPFVWLDEVFANKRIRATGNLWNFRSMIDGMSVLLESPIVCYRTINPAMTVRTEQTFGNDATIIRANEPAEPLGYTDYRDFVSIRIRR